MTKTELKLVADFAEGFSDLNLRYFSAHEFLELGSGHYSGRCEGLNNLPPRKLHSNIYEVALVWDEIRHRLRKPITVLSVYRGPAYNSCIGGVENSQHKEGTATDATSSEASAADIFKIANDLRLEGAFKGGLGVYNRSNFVHADVRGRNATWKGN